MNLLELRTELASLLSASLGTYTLPNGDTTPAISVRSSGEALPTGTTVTGLEVVLIRDPDLTPIPQYTDSGALRSWTVFLIDWSDATDLEPIGAYLVEAYPGTQVTTVAVPKGTGPQNQMRVTIQSVAQPPAGFPAYDPVRFPTVSALAFETDASIDPAQGQITWESDTSTLILGLTDDLDLHLGADQITLCRNNSNSAAIPKGTGVMLAGTVGNSGRLKVAPMVANGTYPGYVFFGVTSEIIPAGGDGFVTSFGKVRGINTTAYNEGDILWCDPATPGGFTATEPQAPNLKLPIAAVVHDASNGILMVRWSIGARLKDLHDVEANGNKDDGDVLAWIAANNRWEPVAPDSGATGPAGPTGATGPVGATGAAGTIGVDGSTGATGATGPQGATGAAGTIGVDGSTGATGATGVGTTGATGVAGPTGATGVSGATGPSGPEGPTGAQGTAGADGATGATGATGIPGATGAGVTGATGIQGPTGVAGATGATGIAGATGVGITGATGIQGATGVAGPTGATGVQGSTGVIGVTGATGAAGVIGISGATGPVGATGVEGPTGASGVTGATGPQGATGAGATGVAGVDGATGATGAGATGATGAVGATGAIGATGVQGSTGVSGPTGATGIQGSTGPAGVTGATGATGVIGVSGATGPVGATGVQGATGAVGATGATGVQGATGVGTTGATGAEGTNGATGATGVAGPTGASGVAGVTGATGPAGVTGATGVAGVDGATGATGASGVTGATGVSGVSGATGIQGATGATGVQGSTGPTGATGVIGVSGATGVAGVDGATGATGVIGVSGATGATGVIGVSGATGVIGVSGATGVAGADGATGATGVVGVSGSTGATGVVGVTGATGATGIQGPTGVIGISGATGATGAEGVSGATGATGAAGTNGATGVTGVTGATGPGGPNALAAGSATGPSLYFTGDDNTGLWSPGADTIAVSTGGSERARIGSDGLATFKGDVKLDAGGSFTTTLQTTTPTANRTATLPDASGTIAYVAGSNTQFIYNNNGAYAGLSNLTTDGTNITVGGTLSFPLGSAGSPSLYPGTDTNTGIWSPAADTVAISTGGSERFRITSSGLVGIGTSSPAALLQTAAGTATANTAPIKLTSGTNLTTAEAGAIEYDGAAAYFTPDTTVGRGFLPATQTFRLTSNGSSINQNIANFFGATSNIPLAANAFYEIDIYMLAARGSTAGTATITLTNSAAPTRMFVDYEQSPLAGVAAPPGSVTALTNLNFRGTTTTTTAAYAFTTGTLAASVNHYFRLKLLLQNGNGTRLLLQMTAGTGNNSMTPQAGSVWFCRRLPGANTGTFAA